MNKTKREQKQFEEAMHEWYMVEAGYGAEQANRQLAREKRYREKLKAMVDNMMRAEPLPEFLDELDLSVESYYEIVSDFFVSGWDELFGVPNFRLFVSEFKRIECEIRLITDCYGLFLNGLGSWAVNHEDELVEFVMKQRESKYISDKTILERIFGLAHNGLDFLHYMEGAWLEHVSFCDNWKDDAGEWTSAGMHIYKYLKKSFQTAKRGSWRWKELADECLVNSFE